MNDTFDHNGHGGWQHVLSIVAIAAFAIVLWRSATEMAPTQEQESKMAELATLLGSRSASASDIDSRLRSFGPFPPDPKASRALSEALITCGATSFDEPRRRELARQLYGITVIGDSRIETVSAALLSIEESFAATRCSPATLDELMHAARAVARTDPNPRRDWW